MKDILVPPMLSSLVVAGLIGIDGHTFDNLATCPHCGGEVTGYDYKERKFATLIEEGGSRTIRVRVKRFSCRSCGRVSYAEAPFYEDANLGAPVVDLCVTLSASMAYNRVSRVLGSMGILVDRGTIRNYSGRDAAAVATTRIYGFLLPLSILTLSSFVVNGQGGSVPGAEPVVPRRLPPADRASSLFPPAE
ncbi:MAG: hypothetical protein LUQ25_00770 [Methanoregulaceae archaeon]|nr:hypothetical protein [Methanoregulaceae archaeon]